MRSIEDKSCYSNGATTPVHNQQEIPSSNGAISFEFHKGSRTDKNSSSARNNHRQQHHMIVLGKPTPSRWEDAQKWLVGLSRGGGGGGGGDKNQIQHPRNSNADDQQELECDDESIWRINKPATGCSINPVVSAAPLVIRSICVRDMGTEDDDDEEEDGYSSGERDGEVKIGRRKLRGR